MITISNLSKDYSGRTLFKDVSMTIATGEKIGLVGRNGTGKSTLFKIILGEEQPSSGDISVPKMWKIGSLSQHLHFTHSTVIDECFSALIDGEEYERYKAEKILFGLGFSKEDMQASPLSFSGGYQIRINLAKVLVTEPDLILLDEPTNYLDIVSMRWLRTYLNRYPGSFIIVTHDREFMDSVTNTTMGIHRTNVRKIPGSTVKFYDQLSMEEEIYEKARVNQDKKIKEMEQFVDRFKAKASKAAQAQSRVKMLEKMESMDRLEDIASLNFRFPYQNCPGKVLMQVNDVGHAYPNKDKLFSELTFPIQKSDRIAIIGKNGKGKSTLLNILAEDLNPMEGGLQLHPEARVGHFGQTNIERLNPKNTIATEIGNMNHDMTTSKVRAICGTMMFKGDDAEKKISVLSGGEKARVLLGKLLTMPTNLLLLDEPTNHLDYESIESLVAQLEHYPGAIVLVTHSESLLRKVATKFVVFHQGKAEVFLGTYDDFLEKVGWQEEDAEDDTSKSKAKEKRKQDQDANKEKSKAEAKRKKLMEESEKKILQNEQKKEALQKQIVKLSSQGGGVHQAMEIERFSRDLHTLDEELEKLYADYEKLSSS